MRITFVLGGLNMTGGTKVLSIYADRLQRRGHEVAVVARPPKRMKVTSRVKSVLTGRGWPELPKRPRSFFDGSSLNVHLIDKYRPVVDADVPDADVVVATWWETAEWVGALSPSKGAKVHFIQCQEGYPLFRDPAVVARTAAIYKLPMMRITISHSLVDWLREQQGCDPAAMPLIPIAIDPNQFHAPPRGKQAFPTVGLLYHFDPSKGVDVSRKALELVARQLPDLRVISFGSYVPADEQLLPPGTLFHHSPPQDKIRDIYAQCDVWLCASRVEGFHAPPMEAMACRCPVVSTRVGGPDQIVQDGVNGYLVPIDDADGLADRLLKVLTLPDADWLAMSDAALRTTQGYTWDDATDRFEAALRTAAQGHGQP